MNQIKNRFTGEVIAKSETTEIAELASENKANLYGANLYGADLCDADLTGANLYGANLTGANLTRANLTMIKISWTSHHLISEILYRAATTEKDAKIQVEKRKVAGLIAISIDWCWTEFIAINDPLTDWAIAVLAPYAENDPNAPSVFKTTRGDKR